MRLVKGAWKLLVGIKDGLVLIAMLIFFGLLFTALSARPNGSVRDGALVLDLDGTVVEQPATADPRAILTGSDMAKEVRLRDVVRALDAAKDDARVKAVVLDLDRFRGGYPAAVGEVAAAVGRVRASGKPVLAYATAYLDSSYMIAANASEVWMHPMGGTLFTGPGGSQLYYKGLVDKLGVNVHVYKVGKFKSAVEPYILAGQSPEARQASEQLYGSLFAQWQQFVAKARPKAKIQPFLTAPEQVVAAANGDIAQANLAAGIVDKLGDRTAFGKRVAQLAGGDGNKPLGWYKSIKYDDWLAAHPLPKGGDAVGVLTIAGEIVDGKGGRGNVGGDTVVKALFDGIAKKKLKALVVRIDSPGGSALASEQMRLAILEAKAKGLPVVVSMGSLAASGGYWVATAGDTIFAEPNTITGSIGIFGIIPTFENALAKVGVTADGVKATPLSGQPDVIGGLSPQVDAILQAGIANGYRQFLSRVSMARHMTPERVDQIGQGHVWDGGTARQLGLVDRFGTLDDAVAEAGRRAKLDPKNVHAQWLEKEPGFLDRLAAGWSRPRDDDAALDAFARIAAERRDLAVRALTDMQRLVRGPAIQARCLECDGLAGAPVPAGGARLIDLLLAKLLP